MAAASLAFGLVQCQALPLMPTNTDCHGGGRWGSIPDPDRIPYLVGMRIQYALIALLAMQGGLRAQTGVLHSNEMPPVGTTFTYVTVQNMAVMDTTTGLNVTWDMADIIPVQEVPWNVYHMAPAATPHPTTFPAANYATYESELPRYNYYDLNADRMERVGYWATQASTYTDRQIELTFPLQYGTTSSDTWANTVSSFGGTYNFRVIGTGTLVLPGGTYTDVLLMRVVLQEVFEIEQYIWTSAQNGASLLIYFPGDGFWITPAAAYVVGSNVGITEPEAGIDLRVQGLVMDQLHLTYATDHPMTAMIYSAGGQLVHTERLPSSATPSTRMLNVAALPAGLHVLVLQGEQGARASARFVKP